MPRGPWPLTERVLHLLPGSKSVWMAVWGATPLLQFAFATAAERLYQLRPVGPAELVTWTYANLLILAGLGWLASQLQALGPTLERLAPDHHDRPADPFFRATGSVTGPLVTSLAILAANLIPALVRAPHPALIAGSVLVFIALLPLATGIWVYVAMLLDLDHVGRTPLRLLPFEEDRSLGLRPLGGVAFSSFLIVTAVVAPVVIYAATDLRRLLLNIAIYFAATALIFAALYRLHRQMLAVKREHLAWARGRYARAVKAVRGDPSGAALRAHADELRAAESLERHASAILEWPVDETTVVRLAAILSSVSAAVIARLILRR